jgi:hypothetical protein
MDMITPDPATQNNQCMKLSLKELSPILQTLCSVVVDTVHAY